jgi:hypothetical protein
MLDLRRGSALYPQLTLHPSRNFQVEEAIFNRAALGVILTTRYSKVSRDLEDKIVVVHQVFVTMYKTVCKHRCAVSALIQNAHVTFLSLSPPNVCHTRSTGLRPWQTCNLSSPSLALVSTIPAVKLRSQRLRHARQLGYRRL